LAGLSDMKATPVILGQTAVGKTAVAVEAAARLRGEIVSADAMQVYREMNLATAKPSAEDRRRVPHHLVDFLDLDEPYSVARFRNLALDLLPEIRKRGRLPLVVGGSALYLKALIDGLSPGPPPSEGFRRLLAAEEKSQGPGCLYRRLLEADPETAQNLHRHDLKRIIRALEVIELTGRSISSQRVRWDRPEEEGHFLQDEAGAPVMPEYGLRMPLAGDFLLIGLRRGREDLRRRIELRVEKMFAAGLVEETRDLIRMGAREHRVAWQALGYKEVERHLRGECSLEEARGRLAANTWKFARRQMTWWRRDGRIRWLDIPPEEPPAETASRVIALLEAWKAG